MLMERRAPALFRTPLQPFGSLLKEWRGRRRKSQLGLALDGGISARHLSFVESGRSTPSRDMVVTLAEALEVPLRDRDGLLLAAGYAPMYRESTIDSASWVQVERALARMLEHQEPYPAVVLDPHWNVRQTNRAAPRLFAHFTDLSVLPKPMNLLRSVFDPRGLRPWIANWDTVAHTLVRRVFREAVAGVPHPEVLAALRELGAYPEPSSAWRAAEGQDLPFHPVRFRQGDLRLSFFSMITTVGAPADITAQELRIESFFPADAITEQFAREELTTAS